MFSPGLECDPHFYSGDFEDMLNDGESRETILDSMKNSIRHTVNFCCIDFKKHVNTSKFTNLYIILSDYFNLSLDQSW